MSRPTRSESPQLAARGSPTVLKTTPNYLKELVSNPSVQQVPVVYQYLTRILSQTLEFPSKLCEPFTLGLSAHGDGDAAGREGAVHASTSA